jgi:hypothetical protein
MSSCLAKPKKWHSVEIESKFIGPLHASQIWKHSHWAFRYTNKLNVLNTSWTLVSAHEHQWVSIEHLLNTCECTWLPTSEYSTSIECAWTSLSHNWTWLTMVWLWERLHLCQNWTRRKHLWEHMNAVEWVLTNPWTPIECARMPMSEWEQPLNTHCVGMNALE